MNALEKKTRKCNEVWQVLLRYPLANPKLEAERAGLEYRFFSRWARRYHKVEYMAWLKAATLVQLSSLVERPEQEKWIHLVSALVYKLGKRNVYLSAEELKLGAEAAVLAEAPSNGGLWLHWFQNYEELLHYFASNSKFRGNQLIIKPLPVPASARPEQSTNAPHTNDSNHHEQQQRTGQANRVRSTGYYWQQSGPGGNPSDKNFGPTPPPQRGNLPQHPHLPTPLLTSGADSNDEPDSNAA